VQLRYWIEHSIHPLNNAGLSEGHAILMKEQSSFVHSLARLLKWWDHTLLVPGYKHGRSFRMELFAIIAGQEEQFDMARALKIALAKIRDFASLNVIFARFYDRDCVPDCVAAAKPLLLDPSNPLNNMLDQTALPHFLTLARFAAHTLGRLDLMERGATVDIFEPQPVAWDTSFTNFRVKEGSWIISWQLNAKTVQTHVVPQKMPLLELKHVSALANLIGLSQWGQGALPIEDKLEAVKSTINKHFTGGTKEWKETSQSFSSKDVLVVSPVHDGLGSCIIVGFDVEKRDENAASTDSKRS